MSYHNSKLNAPLRARVLDGLVILRDTLAAEGRVASATHGICSNVVEVMMFRNLLGGWHSCGGGTSSDVYDIISDLSRHWPKYSGNINYPVPAPGCLGGPDMAKQAEVHYGCDAWAGEYGALRRELLDFIIERLENSDE